MGTCPITIYTLLETVSEFTVKERERKRVGNSMKSVKIKQKIQQKKDHYKKKIKMEASLAFVLKKTKF